ncbi:LysR family transcriptional regulator [Klebsiella quasipneumoniae]
MIFSRKINHFMTIIEEGSYNRASETLCLTTSALRHSIYELERSVSSKLFKRSTSGVALTDSGRFLYDSLSPTYHEAKKVYDNFLRNSHTIDTVKVYMDGFYYPAIVDEFKQIQESLSKNVIISQTENSSLEELRLGHCDIAITTAPGMLPSSKNISNLFLSREKVGLLVHRDVLRKYRDIKSLIKHERIFHRSEMINHPILKHVCNRIDNYGLEYKTMGLPDISDILETISYGNGIALMSSDFIEKRSYNEARLEFLTNPFPEPITFERHMFFNTNNYHELSQVASILKSAT